MKLGKTITNIKNSKNRFFNFEQEYLTLDLIRVGIIFKKLFDLNRKGEIIKMEENDRYKNNGFTFKYKCLENGDYIYSFRGNIDNKYKIYIK